MSSKRPSPREFMKGRHPEEFSDSTAEDDPELDRSMLEYHLDSLTSRSQEAAFERFARRLAKREICPNLLPQTGPTGGGDSKVDAETFPVADRLSLVWHSGVGREAASERWAFAFSAKKTWQPKVRSDILKIAATARGYTKAFFITNQFVADRVRAKVEDELRLACGMDVRILDRSWILDRVFGGGHEELAIEELGLSPSVRPHARTGPLDVRRQAGLAEIEQRIETAVREGRLGPQLADGCLEAALLARGLDRPRTEVEGQFARARRVAEECGTPHQRLLSVYHTAWTTYWWYEDYRLFAKLYGEVEARAAESRNAHDLELLTNLWFILYPLAGLGDLSAAEAVLEQRTETLSASLRRLSQERDRPSTALQARTLLLVTELMRSLRDDPDPVLRELRSVVHECQGLVGYSFDRLVRLLEEAGDALVDSRAYGDLVDAIAEIVASRRGEVAAARVLLKRGEQQLGADRAYEAIRSLGRALGRLYKHESRQDLVHALYLCADAYERVGLLWAARGTLLNAACIAVDEFWTHSKVTEAQAACYRRLQWVEVRLGRVHHALAWHELYCAASVLLAPRGREGVCSDEEQSHFDTILVILMLRAGMDQLQSLSKLPDALSRLGLYASESALLFVLGHEQRAAEMWPEAGYQREALSGFFRRWRDQPAAAGLAAPSFGLAPTATFGSTILGCQVTLVSDAGQPCVHLAESVLGALESLLSTGLRSGVVAKEPTLTVHVVGSDAADEHLRFAMSDRDGRPHLEVQCGPFDPDAMPDEVQTTVKEALFDLVATVLPRVFILGNDEESMKQLLGDERAIERAIDFTGSFVTAGSILGHPSTPSLWARSEPADREYPLLRAKAWDQGDRDQQPRTAPTRVPAFGAGEPPPDVLDPDSAKHTEIRNVSLIRQALWERALWVGTAFVRYHGPERPPVLALIFRGEAAAREIFQHWRADVGARDEEDRLRVTVVRGIIRERPHAYRVVVGSNLETAMAAVGPRYFINAPLCCTMDPPSGRNLDEFLQAYGASGQYQLGYAIAGADGSSVTPTFSDSVAKRELHVRNAWEIGRHDPDTAGIMPDDDPIIPPDVESAPVLALLEWKRKRR